MASEVAAPRVLTGLVVPRAPGDGRPMRALPPAAFVLLLVALGAGCGDGPADPPGDAGLMADGAPADGASLDGAAPTACIPQLVAACDCGALAPGMASCLPSGSGFGPCDCATYGRELFVAVDGDDAASGEAGAPKATLAGALAAVRALVAGGGLPVGGVAISMAGGVYPLTDTVQIGPDVSGTADRPVVIRALPGAPVRLVGGTRLPSAGFAALSPSDPNYARVDAAARSSVKVFDLSAAGVTDFGALQTRGFCSYGVHAPLEVFVDGAPMRLGRWPDLDENDVVVPSATGASVDLYGTVTPDVTGHYVMEGSSDGASVFRRDGLVGGLQYRLYRLDWVYLGNPYRAWFLTTGASGYPNDTDPWWSLYASDFERPMEPSAGGVGQVLFVDPQAINHGFVTTAAASSDATFQYAQTRPNAWGSASDAWLHGFWRYGWADCHLPLASLDPASRSITLGSAPSYGLIAGAPWYAYNLLEEVTQPGEWYLDRVSGRLYFYPPYDLASAEVLVSRLDGPLVRLSDAQFVELHGLVLEAGRGDLLELRGGTQNRAVGVTLRNAGANGAVVSGVDNGVRDSLVYGEGSAGVVLRGGDRPSLTPANNFVERSELHDFARWDWTYRPAVDLSGVGQRVSHNLIHHAPHNALLYTGNEHLIELNEIHDTNRFSNDAGAIYGGRDWGGRGIVIRNNYLHDLRTFFPGTGIVGIYLDDCLSGNDVLGNVLVDLAGTGILHGGGRDDHLNGNVMVRANTGISSDARCTTWARPNDTPGDSGNLLEKLLLMNYQSPPWSTRYPECAAIPNNYPAIFDPAATWLFPEGSTFSSNVGYQVNTWMADQDDAFAHFVQANDPELSSSPFVDESVGDRTLTADVLAVPGFMPIPVEDIGLP